VFDAGTKESAGAGHAGPEHGLSELYWLTAYAPDPLFFREWLHFKVHAIGPTTLRAITTSRARSLVPGLPLSVTVCIPAAGTFTLRARVESAGAGLRPGELEVLLALDAPSRRFAEAAAELLAGARDDVTLATLRDQGFAVRGIDRAITCGYVETEDDMRQVLELRLAAYHSKNKFAFAKTAADMRDEYDAHARQIVCRVGGRIVGAVRVLFVDGKRERSEEVALGAPLPDWLFAEPFGEVSRLCSHPEYRGSDVLVTLMRHLGRVGIQSGLTRLVASCDDQCALYLKLGFQKIGVTYDAYGRKGIDVIAAPVQNLVNGTAVQPFVWGTIHGPIIDFVVRRGQAKPGALGRARAAMFRALRGPIEAIARAGMDRARARKKRDTKTCCPECAS
jgi:hypothetical protein